MRWACRRSADTLKKPELDQLAAAQQARPAPSFRAFLAQAAKADPQLKASVAAYEKKAPLAGDDLTNIARLLGLYNRLHNQKAVIASIEAMVAMPTVRIDKVPPHENKAIIEFGQLVEKMAKDFGLAVPQRRQPHLRGQAAGPRQARSSASSPMPTWCPRCWRNGCWTTARGSIRSR